MQKQLDMPHQINDVAQNLKIKQSHPENYQSDQQDFRIVKVDFALIRFWKALFPFHAS